MDENKRKYLFIMGAILVLIILLLSFIIPQSNDNHNKLESITYDIWIEADDSVSYLIKVPIIVDVNDAASDMMNNIDLIEGNCSWLIETTNHGTMLSINASGDIWLKARKNVSIDFFLTTGQHPEGMDDFDFIADSQQNEYQLGNVMVELNWTSNQSSDISLFLFLNLGNEHHISEQTNLSDGWQQVAIRYGATVP